MRENERQAVVRALMARVQHYSASELRQVRDRLTTRIKQGEVSLGDNEADLLALGELDRLAAQKQRAEQEEAFSEDQLSRLDVARLTEMTGVSSDLAAKYIKERGSPFASGLKRREQAQPAPDVEQPVRAPSRREAVEADEKQIRMDQLRK